MSGKSFFRLHKTSCLVLGVTFVIVLSLLFAPAYSSSSNPCGACHGYSQYLDIREGGSGNQIPATIGVGETKVISAVIENLVDAPTYNVLSSVSVTLRSKNGHFSVTTPVCNIGDLSKGTINAVWEIKGISVGEDSLLISATATNAHESLSFSDNYLPAPSIIVTAAPSALSISLTSPVNGESWHAESTQTINWSVTSGTEPVSIALDYSASGINGPWTTIATGLQGNGSYAWVVPNNPSASSYVRANVSDSTVPPNNALATSRIEVLAAAIPEFPSTPLMMTLLLATVILAVLLKRKMKNVNGLQFPRSQGTFERRVPFSPLKFTGDFKIEWS